MGAPTLRRFLLACFVLPLFVFSRPAPHLSCFSSSPLRFRSCSTPGTAPNTCRNKLERKDGGADGSHTQTHERVTAASAARMARWWPSLEGESVGADDVAALSHAVRTLSGSAGFLSPVLRGRPVTGCTPQRCRVASRGVRACEHAYIGAFCELPADPRMDRAGDVLLLSVCHWVGLAPHRGPGPARCVVIHMARPACAPSRR